MIWGKGHQYRLIISLAAVCTAAGCAVEPSQEAAGPKVAVTEVEAQSTTFASSNEDLENVDQETLSAALTSYEETIHPLFAELGCNGCHIPNGSAAPEFAADSPQISMDALLENAKLDLKIAAKSRIYQKVAQTKHNCSDCEAAGEAILTAIQQWLDAGGSALADGVGNGTPTSTIQWDDIGGSIVGVNNDPVILLEATNAEVRAPMRLYQTGTGASYLAAKEADGAEVINADNTITDVPTDLRHGMAHFEFTAREGEVDAYPWFAFRCTANTNNSFYVQINSEPPFRAEINIGGINWTLTEFALRRITNEPIKLAAGVNSVRIFHRETDCYLRTVYFTTLDPDGNLIAERNQWEPLDVTGTQVVGYNLDYDISSLVGLGPGQAKLQAKLRPYTADAGKVSGLRLLASGLEKSINVRNLRLCLLQNDHEDCPENLATFKSVNSDIAAGDSITELSTAALIVPKPPDLTGLGFIFKGTWEAKE